MGEGRLLKIRVHIEILKIISNVATFLFLIIESIKVWFFLFYVRSQQLCKLSRGGRVILIVCVWASNCSDGVSCQWELFSSWSLQKEPEIARNRKFLPPRPPNAVAAVTCHWFGVAGLSLLGVMRVPLPIIKITPNSSFLPQTLLSPLSVLFSKHPVVT